MARPTVERIARVHNWRGLNIYDTPNAIGEGELADVTNFDLSPGGELIKRTGFQTTHNGVTLGANDVRILGFFVSGTIEQFIARAGSNLYTSPDAVTWTLMPGGPWGNVEHGIQYTDKFYMVRRDDTIIQWDGTTATAIAGTPSGTHCRAFKDRLFVINTFGTGNTPSRVYYSNPFDLTSTGWPATNYLGVGQGDGDFITAIHATQQLVFIFKTNAIWILHVQGDDLSWILRPFKNAIGCVSKYTIAEQDGLVYFLGVQGVYVTDGNTARQISQPILPLFNQLVVSTSTINQSSAFIWKDRYILSLLTIDSSVTWASWATRTWASLNTTPWAAGNIYTYLVYHIREKGWTKWKLAGTLRPHIFVPVILRSTLKGVYSGDRASNGKVYKFGNVTYQDDLVSYEAMAKTREDNFGSATDLKRGKWIGVELQTVGDFSITYTVNGVTREAILGTSDSTIQEQKLEGPGYFRSWQTTFSAIHANPVLLFAYDLHIMSRYRYEYNSHIPDAQ